MKKKSVGRKRKVYAHKLLCVYYIAVFLCVAIFIDFLWAILIHIPKVTKNSEVLNKSCGIIYKKVLAYKVPIMDEYVNYGVNDTDKELEIQNLVENIFSIYFNERLSIFKQRTSTLDKNHDNGSIINETSNINQEITEDEVFSDSLESSVSFENKEEVEKEYLLNSEILTNKKITIMNETKNKVNIEQLLKEPLRFKFNKKSDKILIYHTHTTESYIEDISQLDSQILTRTTDPKYSVVRVGKELSNEFKNMFNYQVIHNTTIHDYPNYNKSYINALKNITGILEDKPSVKIVIDLHRDAIANNKKLRKVGNMNEKKVAKIMFVVATGEAEKNHPRWKENLKLALKIQDNLNEICPELTQNIHLCKYRYNQHMSSGAMLIEIGGDGNLMEECLESTKYLARAINDVIAK